MLIEEKNLLPIIISNSFTQKEDQLLRVLQDHKTIIVWTIFDIKGSAILLHAQKFNGRVLQAFSGASMQIKFDYERSGDKGDPKALGCKNHFSYLIATGLVQYKWCRRKGESPWF